VAFSIGNSEQNPANNAAYILLRATLQEKLRNRSTSQVGGNVERRAHSQSVISTQEFALISNIRALIDKPRLSRQSVIAN
jgi:hypothetical protein